MANPLPDFGQIDRGQALERGFELASRTENDEDGLVSHRFLSFFPMISAKAKPKRRTKKEAIGSRCSRNSCVAEATPGLQAN
jgi:hypothetical protein